MVNPDADGSGWSGDAEEWLSFFMPGGSPCLGLVVSDSISIPSAEIKRIAGDSHEVSPAAGLLLSSLDVGDAAPSTHPNALCVAEVTNETKCDPYVSCGVGVTSNMGDSGAGVPFS